MLDIASYGTRPSQMLSQAAAKDPQTALRTADKLQAAKTKAAQDKEGDKDLRKAFDTFVGETFYGQMLSSMRKTQKTPAYFNGGRAEEVFRGQLDQTLASEMSKSNANSFTGSLYDLFALNRK